MGEWAPDVLRVDGDGGETLDARRTAEALALLAISVRELGARLRQIQTTGVGGDDGGGGTAVGVSGFTFIDVSLTGNLIVAVPIADPNAVVCWVFKHGTGGWNVSWPSPEFPTKPRMGTEANKESIACFRKDPSDGKFHYLFHAIDLTIA